MTSSGSVELSTIRATPVVGGAANSPPASSEPANLGQTIARGAVISVSGQGASVLLRMGSMVILARLLTPADFGLVGMAAAVTGFLSLIRDAGLGLATVQRAVLSEEQASTLFWINVGLGATLTAACVVLAPAVVMFYGAPNLLWVTVALGSCFFFSGFTAQHRAMLQRAMRFGMMTMIDIAALVISIVLAVGMAWYGQRYWALVAMAVSQPAVAAAGTWLAVRWVPGWPRRTSGIRSMLLFGGTLTLNNVIVYLAYNTDKILVGRFWGASGLGIYGRAYTLSSVANENLYSALSVVAFPTLSRLQHDPARFRSYFLRGYSLFLSLVIPLTVACALFANEIIAVMLGPRWHDAVIIFRLLAPTIVAFGLVHPFSWVMLATGRAARCLGTTMMVAPVVILGYTIGVHWGPQGVAAGFSCAMALTVLPVIFWAKKGTSITGADVFQTVSRPLASTAIAVAASMAVASLVDLIHPPFLRLLLESGILFGIHFSILAFVMKQKTIYLGLLREMRFWVSRKGGQKPILDFSD
jgi:O-antigen/teichoic acid export membrane protein